jgi:rhodanese-related sulfurtransferase
MLREIGATGDCARRQQLIPIRISTKPDSALERRPAWVTAGLPTRKLTQLPVQELSKLLPARDLQLLDVRTPHEWDEGHLPGAHYLFLGDLPKKIWDLNPDKPVVVYCASGYRSSLAATLLQAIGFKRVQNVPGSYCLLGSPLLAAKSTPDSEFPAILSRHPDVQFRLQLRVPTEQSAPVGDLASGDCLRISVEDVLDGQSVAARPGGNTAAGLQVSQQDVPKPRPRTVDLGRVAVHRALRMPQISPLLIQ